MPPSVLGGGPEPGGLLAKGGGTLPWGALFLVFSEYLTVIPLFWLENLKLRVLFIAY